MPAMRRSPTDDLAGGELDRELIAAAAAHQAALAELERQIRAACGRDDVDVGVGIWMRDGKVSVDLELVHETGTAGVQIIHEALRAGAAERLVGQALELGV